VLVGAKTREQLLDNLAAADVSFTPEQLKLLDTSSTLPREYPGWMLERQNSQKRGVPST
jgi:aryl-alcohol dehydrogenase-like predicted oxidoreductase